MRDFLSYNLDKTSHHFGCYYVKKPVTNYLVVLLGWLYHGWGLLGTTVEIVHLIGQDEALWWHAPLNRKQLNGFMPQDGSI